MIIMWGILLSIGLLVIENLIISLSSVSVFLCVIVGILVYILIHKSCGLTILFISSITQDLIYSPLLPITTIAWVLAWLIWGRLIQNFLTASNVLMIFLSSSSWLFFTYLFYWLNNWFMYLIGDTVLKPSWVGGLNILLSFLVNIIILFFLLVFFKWLTKFFNRKSWYVKR
ncbi:MAG: hypothetical protein V1712_01250 [Patescibacteria group bacterium]